MVYLLINGGTITPDGVMKATAAGMVGGLIGGPYPNITNRHFVNNATEYLIDQAAGSFTRTFFGSAALQQE
jgi:hypothetical protein